MTPGTEHFVALLVGVLTIIGLVGGALRVLWQISWRMGQLVERFDNHMKTESDLHQDQERRLRNLEDYRRQQRR
jgi:hypothetical protein